MADALVASNGIISQRMAGKVNTKPFYRTVSVCPTEIKKRTKNMNMLRMWMLVQFLMLIFDFGVSG